MAAGVCREGRTNGKKAIALKKIREFIKKTGLNQFNYENVGVSFRNLHKLVNDGCIRKIGTENGRTIYEMARV